MFSCRVAVSFISSLAPTSYTTPTLARACTRAHVQVKIEAEIATLCSKARKSYSRHCNTIGWVEMHTRSTNLNLALDKALSRASPYQMYQIPPSLPAAVSSTLPKGGAPLGPMLTCWLAT